MRYFMYVVIAAAMLAAFVSSPDAHLGPSIVKYMPDLVSALLVVYIVAAGSRQQFRYVNGKYWLIFGALALVMLCGPLVNQESVGPIVNGLRWYVRAIPLFFVPALANFSDRDLQGYLKFLLGLSLLQIPVAAYQRYYLVTHGMYSGDGVFGTLMISGILSLFLIAAVCIMAALMLRGRISKLWFAVCFVLLIIPMSINETKVTIFLLPLGLLVTFFVASPPGRRSRVMLQSITALIVAGIIFVPLYNELNRRNDGTPFFKIQDLLTQPGMLTKYMDRKAKVGTGEESGRVDSLRAPFVALSNDPIKFIFGLGIGNVSKSGLGSQFSGKYKAVYWNFALELSVTAFLFEIGLLGTSLVLLLHWMVLRDAIYVAKHEDSLVGVLALGYIGAWVVITIGLFYLAIHTFESLSFMFWFFSGLFAARREKIASSRAKANSTFALNVAPLKLRAG